MNVAYIPVRGGSKSIPMKNIKKMAGKPLIWYAVKAACECDAIDKVYVCTDSGEIAEIVKSFNFVKVEVIGRSEASATDTASTEIGMLEFAEKYNFENIALVQATSPLITASDLTKGFAALNENETDSVLSVVLQQRFIWGNNAVGFAEPVNYDYHNRPRRQEFNGFFVENGAFYMTSKSRLLETRCRLSGNIKTVEMPEESYFEIDELSDWIIVEQFLKARKNKKNVNLKMFITDCDGTLTDGGMYYTNDGDVMKKFNTRDGMGFQLLKEKGVITGIITSENSEIVHKRAEKLKIDEIHIGISNKKEILMDLCKKYQINIENIAYIGDDINDLPCIESCGYTACPQDATDEIKSKADYNCRRKGGEGAVREFIERLFFILHH